MSRSILLPTILLGVLAVMVCRPALAHHGHALPPERHVIEVARPPHSGSYIINGAYFTAKSAACWSWNAGDRITLLAGDWHGHCIDAVSQRAAAPAKCGADRCGDACGRASRLWPGLYRRPSLIADQASASRR